MDNEYWERTPADDALEMMWGRSSAYQVFKDETFDLICHHFWACEFSDEELEHNIDVGIVLCGLADVIAEIIERNDLNKQGVCKELANRIEKQLKKLNG